MYRKLLMLSLIGLSAAVPAFAAGPMSVPPASFLDYHISTLSQLTQEVTVDPVVRTRLARHFHVSSAVMTGYINRNLTLTHLKTTGYYQVACVRPNGQEYWVRSYLLAGTPIFASRVTGQPVLKLACGNPMVSALPPGTSDKDTDINGKMNPPQTAETPAQSQMVATTMPALIPGNTVVDTTIASDSFAPDGMQSDIIASPVVKTAGSLQFANFFSPASLADFGPEIIGGGVLAALSGIHHGNSFHASNISSPTPVPEASTSISLGLLLLGGAAFLMIRRKQAIKQAE